MKHFLFSIPLIAIAFISCKKNSQVEIREDEKIKITATELMFTGETDKSKAFSQSSGDKLRVLIPYKANGTKSIFRYKINEYSALQV